MQLSVRAERAFDTKGIASGAYQSAPFANGFPLRFSRPASLNGQTAAWYRSLDGYNYGVNNTRKVSKLLASEHRPAIHSCLSYGLERDYIQESELLALFDDNGAVDDAAALSLSSKVMAGIALRLSEHQKALTSEVLAVSQVSEANEKEMKSLVEWWEQHWLPTLSLSYVEDDFGDYGQHAGTMALRLARDHYVAFMDFHVWDAPKLLQPLLILTIQELSFMSIKPVALCDFEDFGFFEWGEPCDHLYNIVSEEIPYWLDQCDENEQQQHLLTMAKEQCPSILDDIQDSLGDDLEDLWAEILLRHRQSVWQKVLASCKDEWWQGSESDSLPRGEGRYLQVVSNILKDWARLQNPMLGHPISQRLVFLCELYFKQSFAGRHLCSPFDEEYSGDVSFNESAIISTGDDCEDGWVTGYAEGVSTGEYSAEVLGMSFTADLEPTLKRMLFGDLALICLQGVI